LQGGCLTRLAPDLAAGEAGVRQHQFWIIVSWDFGDE
jgi:hypothetical protein